ncbi:MAG TPA: hypothetical protein VEH28_03335 [Thermoplasmata archaeon]|nr:hypothetical protein [Thermoplasmata archaeon]
MNRRVLLATMVTLGVVIVSLLVGYGCAGKLGVLAVVAYLGCILAPGVAMYAVLAGRFRTGPSNLLEAVFFSNLLGFAMVEGAGWVLARSGGFSLPAVLAVEAALVVVPGVLFRKPLLEKLRQTTEPLLSVSVEEASFLGIAVAASCLLLLPLLLLFSNGFFIGADTAPYSQAGWLVASTGRWPSLAWVWWPGASQATTAPGAPIVYAVFSAFTGVLLPPMATVIAIIPVALTPIGLCLLVRRYTGHPLLTYGLPLVWLVGTTDTTGLLYNNTLTTIYSGTHPDATLGLPFLVAVYVLLVDLARGKSDQWFETALLSAAVLASILATQLDFIFVVAALALFGGGIVLARGWKWSFVRLGIVAAPTVVAWPYYLVPSAVASTSTGISGGSIWSPSVWGVNWSEVWNGTGFLAEICAAIVVLAVAAVVVERLRHRAIGSASSSSVGILPLAGLGLLALYLAYSNIATDVIVISATRFFPYASLALIPVIAFGCDRFFHLQWPKRSAAPSQTEAVPTSVVARRRIPIWPVVAAVAVALLLIYAGTVSFENNTNIESNVAGPASLVTPSVLAASLWLKDHAAPSAIIAVDANGGNNAAISPIGAFSDHVAVKRLRVDLYDTLHLPSPQNTSFYLVNLVMTDPTAANAAAAANYGITYYVFEVGYSNAQIAAFSLLPYFSPVYSNNQIAVFEYVGGSTLGFVPAVSYCDSSSSIVPGYSHHAYGYAFSIPALPATPNWIAATANYTLGSLFAAYCLDTPTAGNYTLYVHRYMYSTSQFVGVSAGGPSLGQVFFLSSGAALGTPLTVTLPAGPVYLNLSFLGGVGGAMSPVDYLVLDPDPPSASAVAAGSLFGPLLGGEEG